MKPGAREAAVRDKLRRAMESPLDRGRHSGSVGIAFGIAAIIPLGTADMPISSSPLKYLTAEQVSAVVDNAPPPRDKALVALLYNCGLRRAEVGLLTRSDLTPRSGGGMLRVKRLKKAGFYEHEIVLLRRTAKLLEEYLATRSDYADAMFIGRTGLPLSGQSVYCAYRQAAKAAGIPRDLWHPHALRHSIGVHLRNMGTPIDEIKEHLGHDSLESTLQYARVVTPTKARTAMMAEHSHCIARF
jgi:integrase/recombinase XerD